MGKLCIDVLNKDNLEMVRIVDFKPKKKHRANLINMYIRNSTIWVQKHKREFVIIEIPIDEVDEKEINELFWCYNVFFTYIKSAEEAYYISEWDIKVIESKLKKIPKLKDYFFTELEKYR